MRFPLLIFLLTSFISGQENQLELEILMLCADRIRHDPVNKPNMEILYNCFFNERIKHKPGDFINITDPELHIIHILS
ncbi:hypothetical protein WA026_014976 [Henosepilachna vigintioctopunctata]|uniref:Uncharacterized protein n=1 Tax=Henosepilachna vigintioctopunctata TaxID=420089 RepID=A0AAW1U830_9CUCU